VRGLTKDNFELSDDDWVMVKASRDKATTPYPFMIGSESFIPATRATLRKGEPRLFALFIYNADPNELALDIVPAATLASQTPSEGVTKYVYALDYGAQERVHGHAEGDGSNRRAVGGHFARWHVHPRAYHRDTKTQRRTEKVRDEVF
jgi:hypothetical protein